MVLCYGDASKHIHPSPHCLIILAFCERTKQVSAQITYSLFLNGLLPDSHSLLHSILSRCTELTHFSQVPAEMSPFKEDSFDSHNTRLFGFSFSFLLPLITTNFMYFSFLFFLCPLTQMQFPLE